MTNVHSKPSNNTVGSFNQQRGTLSSILIMLILPSTLLLHPYTTSPQDLSWVTVFLLTVGCSVHKEFVKFTSEIDVVIDVWDEERNAKRGISVTNLCAQLCILPFGSVANSNSE
eukprot:Gb_33795 [translate_table: standard]